MEPLPDLQNEVSIDSLPVEVLTHIFGLLNMRELLTVVPEVSTRWRSIAFVPSLVRVITFQGDDGIDTIRAKASLVASSENLFELNLLGRHDTIALLRTASQNNRRLKSLNIRGSLTSVKNKIIKLMVRSCPDIESIAVRDTLGESEKYLQELCMLQNLKKINFGSSQIRYREFFAPTNADIKQVCSSCPQLTELKLPATNWTDAAVVSISNLKNLEVLGIRFALSVTATSLLYIPRLENLRELELSFMTRGLTSATWISMFTEPTLIQLKVLRIISCSRVDDDVLDAIASNCQQLKQISLANCRSFTGIGFKQVITKCKKLIVINVYNIMMCHLVDCFPLMPVHTPSLRLLVIGPGTLATQPHNVQVRLTRLQSALPLLKLQHEFML